MWKFLLRAQTPFEDKTDRYNRWEGERKIHNSSVRPTHMHNEIHRSGGRTWLQNIRCGTPIASLHYNHLSLLPGLFSIIARSGVEIVQFFSNLRYLWAESEAITADQS